MLLFALTIFTGAFLLFQVQPLIAKYILPWFGGGPGVWTTCMLFFQLLLLGGYAYAHLISRWLKPRAQAIVHLVLLVSALALLPIIPSDAWKPTGGENPVPRILALLLVTVGLPYFVLSTTGPLMQQWFSRANPSRSPYRLFALSNAGSLLALVSYPFFFETHFTRKAQASFWGWGLLAFVLCCGFCAVRLWRSHSPGLKSKVQRGESESGLTEDAPLSSPAPAINSQPSTLNYFLWLLLPACASTLLLATTNKMCQDVAVIPFLWVAPLAIYLVSFIISFDSPRWYRRLPYTVALILVLVAVGWVLPKQSEIPLFLVLGTYSAALFICCMVCHGELYRLKPEPERLTSFYLMVAAGGALGGLFVAVFAPFLFETYAELPWGLFGCGLLLLIACARDPAPADSAKWRRLAWVLPLALLFALDRLLAGLAARPSDVVEGWLLGLRIGGVTFLFLLAYLALAPGNPRSRLVPALVLAFVPWAARRRLSDYPHWRRLACSWLSFGAVLLGLGLFLQSHKFTESKILLSRNFYGVLSLSEVYKHNPDLHCVAEHHGQTLHGLQFTHPIGATYPTAYFTTNSGIGLAVFALPKTPRRFGIIGLGVGTMAAYVRTNDYIHFYEINPEVQRLAESRFTYLSHCPGKMECTLGDGRLSLEREPSQQFDLLALDAFNGDAPPVHLLTLEAFEMYEQHLKTNGVIAVDISNKSLDLLPVLANVARERHFHIAVIDSNTSPDHPFWMLTATWALLSRNEAVLNSPAIQQVARPPDPHIEHVRLWTDDFTSLFQILHPWGIVHNPVEAPGAPSAK
jgi:hypothetical protein